MAKWDGGYEEGRARVFTAVNSACHDRDRFEDWFFDNIGGPCNHEECIKFPGGCMLTAEGLGCAPCIKKGRPCPWKDAYIITVILGELEVPYGKAFQFFTKLLKDPIFRDILRGEYSRNPDPSGVLNPVQIQGRLHEVELELKEAREEIERRDAKLKRLIEDLKETKERLADCKRELSIYTQRQVELAPAGSNNPAAERSSRPFYIGSKRSLAAYRQSGCREERTLNQTRNQIR
ncbi:hypothetical protein CC1G_07247 [Coprinopsis cinerea okayama7|uniref:Uncharacterized protein n=1 Tax=Coprinopsis cinerea (strain Okayama-7 / 130 / ATCC MYA-4618 / FGSC 9003) TaxID=240176 RepID=A8PD31_COPC7|nr:hypothetical protein CC1G_07247 [Coprinopsis cinerea okayama7\|eukprot:XP_001840517.1 hypothetical protein CC1G_07247 [Coprinopsis cinerea okayama7\